MTRPQVLQLPRTAPARVLACGAFLKNTACLLSGTQATLSALHGDLSDPAACAALGQSVQELLALAGGPIDAVAHDLHPDFHSTRLAQQLADELGVPAIAVQHHHAHIAVVQAEQGWAGEAVVGLALDGTGLGEDGTSWGGEVLVVRGAQGERVAHLPTLALPGGDIAAREPWRMAAAALHALGRGAEIVPRFGPTVGETLARGVQTMLARDLNCPRSSAAGRWFDAAAGALVLSVRQSREAEAAMELETVAGRWLSARETPVPEFATLDLLPLVGELFDAKPGVGAARFHQAMAAGFVAAAVRAAAAAETDRVALGGGCFFNRVLSDAIKAGLGHAGLRVHCAQAVGVSDAGLALGQAWAAALQVVSH
jgi:hydrogenase maturation protein HypF